MGRYCGYEQGAVRVWRYCGSKGSAVGVGVQWVGKCHGSGEVLWEWDGEWGLLFHNPNVLSSCFASLHQGDFRPNNLFAYNILLSVIIIRT